MVFATSLQSIFIIIVAVVSQKGIETRTEIIWFGV